MLTGRARLQKREDCHRGSATAPHQQPFVRGVDLGMASEWLHTGPRETKRTCSERGCVVLPVLLEGLNAGRPGGLKARRPERCAQGGRRPLIFRYTQVHVGRGDMPAAIARRLLGPHKIVGVSTYGSRADVAAALRPEVEADYVGSPAVFATSTKPSAASAGVAHLGEMRQWVAEELRRRGRQPSTLGVAPACPVVAIGGIAPGNASSCVVAGADGLAVVSALLAPAQPSGVREAAVALCAALPA